MALSEANITQVRNEARALIQEERTAAAVSVKLPPFWPEKARFWFTIVEANFVTGRITDEKTKFYHVVRQLDSDTAGRLMDIIENPPDTDSFKALKKRLLESFELNDRERASRIIDWPGLGDRKPSQCLEDMIQIMPSGTKDLGILFKEHFLRLLSADVRSLLAQSTNMKASTVESMRLLAKEADEYYESSGARVNALTNQAETMSIGPSAPIDTDPVLDSQEVFAISGRGGYAPRGLRGGFGSRGRGGSRGKNQYRQRFPPKPVTFCHYHAQFGVNARQCLSPCEFQSTLLAKNAQDRQQPQPQGNGLAGRGQ